MRREIKYYTPYHLMMVYILILLMAALTLTGCTSSKEKTKPNFIIIFTDDQGYNDVGCFGSENIKTPVLDRMAAEGIKFTSFYSQPVCGPARIALLTGCYPPRVNYGGWRLATEEITIAEVLKSAGYTTGCIGKWDVSSRKYIDGMVPNDQGFDYYFGALGANDRGVVTLYRNRDSLNQVNDMGSLTKMYTDEALEFIEASSNSPFFLYLAHTMPHVELGVSNQFAGKSRAGLYGDVIEEIDWNVGRIIDKLKALSLDKNTYVLFTSDNGPWLSKGEMGGSAKPLRGGKGSAWEGGFRVPAILWAPGHAPEGVVNNEMISTLDILPTFASLAGAEISDSLIIDGVSLVNMFSGESNISERETFNYYVRGNLHAVRKGKWKLALPNRVKFFSYAGDDVQIVKPELYNLEIDISEQNNIADENPKIVEQLLSYAEQVRQDIGDVGRIGETSRKNPNKN